MFESVVFKECGGRRERCDFGSDEEVVVMFDIQSTRLSFVCRAIGENIVDDESIDDFIGLSA